MDLTLVEIAILLLTGVATGIVSGFAGVGGGIVMVPILLELYRAWGLPQGVIVQSVMATSLAVGAFSTGSSANRHHRHDRVLWPLVWPIFPASMLSAAGGSWIASQVEGRWLQAFLGCALIYAAFDLARKREAAGGDSAAEIRQRPWWTWALVGFGVGLFAGLSGLAGGVVLVPALSLLGRVPARYLAGTSSAVVMFTSAAAAIGYAVNGPEPALGGTFVGYVNWAAVLCLAAAAVPLAQLGASLNRKTDATWFRRIFAVLLVVVAVRLLLTLR